MERVIDVAQYIFEAYKKESGHIIDEMKLHKLLYFSQRESLALLNKPLFNEPMQGWNTVLYALLYAAHIQNMGFMPKHIPYRTKVHISSIILWLNIALLKHGS